MLIPQKRAALSVQNWVARKETKHQEERDRPAGAGKKTEADGWTDGRTDKTHRRLTDCTWKWPQALPAPDAALWLSRTHHPQHRTGQDSTARLGSARLPRTEQGRAELREAPLPLPARPAGAAAEAERGAAPPAEPPAGRCPCCPRCPPVPGVPAVPRVPLSPVSPVLLPALPSTGVRLAPHHAAGSGGRESFLQMGRNGSHKQAMPSPCLPGCISSTGDFLSPLLFLLFSPRGSCAVIFNKVLHRSTTTPHLPLFLFSAIQFTSLDLVLLDGVINTLLLCAVSRAL